MNKYKKLAWPGIVLLAAIVIIVLFVKDNVIGGSNEAAASQISENNSTGSLSNSSQENVDEVQPYGTGIGREQQEDVAVSTVENGVQTVTTSLSSGTYEPIQVKAGIPVKWTITADSQDLNGCNNEIILQDFGIQQELKPGDNVIEFTPANEGEFYYSCWMGMQYSTITVTDTDGNINSNDPGYVTGSQPKSSCCN